MNIEALSHQEHTFAPVSTSLCDIGMIGLGVMGRNLLLNMSDQGFLVAGYDRDIKQIEALTIEAKKSGNTNVNAFSELSTFVHQLSKPRAVMLLIPAGTAVDSVISELRQYLESGDIVIDGANSHFKDTNRRSQYLAKENIYFLGIGISGGEAGARHGPSIMPGGPQKAYERVRPIFEAVAARIKNKPCVAWLGSGSAGHFVKMVHNGIEYGLMQLLAETYDLMKNGMGMNNPELQQAYASWNEGELNGYLVEITRDIFAQTDVRTGKQLIDQILDIARQKGTGMWTSQSAMELQVPTPTIDMAVAMRDMSMFADQRIKAYEIYQHAVATTLLIGGARADVIRQLGRALYTAMIITYAQGMALLTAASTKYEYQLNSEAIALLWRGGCIIRADILNDISAAFNTNPNVENLLLDAKLATMVIERQDDLRSCIITAIKLGIPMPAFMASLCYFDAYRSAQSPANLIQAQRDYFGAHTYERIDKKGSFHTEWQHA